MRSWFYSVTIQVSTQLKCYASRSIMFKKLTFIAHYYRCVSPGVLLARSCECLLLAVSSIEAGPDGAPTGLKPRWVPKGWNKLTFTWLSQYNNRFLTFLPSSLLTFFFNLFSFWNVLIDFDFDFWSLYLLWTTVFDWHFFTYAHQIIIRYKIFIQKRLMCSPRRLEADTSCQSITLSAFCNFKWATL